MTIAIRACLIALGIAAAAATPSSAFADSFGAIAYSPETGATGWSYDFRSRRAAENEAQSNCDADDCRVAIWFKNGCGAVAAGPDGWGSGWGGNRRRAEREAINSCNQNSYDCRIVRWQCSGAN